ncbi:MAG: Asp-tRNA(Asn)/Glu-tRNA(Gln) amidotransferase subunit GatA [Patescibacteria group bacterium]
MDLHTFTIRSLGEGFRKKEFSVTEVTKYFFDEIKKKDKDIGSYLSLMDEQALVEAKYADELFREGKASSITGIPLAIKDNFLIEGTKTTAASKILEHYVASYDATVIRKLKDEHVVFLGKTNMDEFAMGSSTENSAFHVTKNPYDITRVPGGSSGGSAAAVSAGLAVGALGSDTAGSIRQPAAFCGVVGLKPTYGSVSRFGLIAMASSFDHVGPITKTVEDAAILYDAIKGYDRFDATSISGEQPSTTEMDVDYIKKLVIGIPKECFEFELEKEVREGIEMAIEKFKKLGFTLKEVSLPHIKYSVPAYYIITPAEVSANLARFDGIRYGNISDLKSEISNLRELYEKSRGVGFGPETKRRILLGTFVLSAGYYDAYYGKAKKIQECIVENFNAVFDKKEDGVDVVFMPTTPTRAFKIGEKTGDPVSMYLSDIFTVPTNFAGVPSLSLPVKKYDREKKELPIGFQLIGKKMYEKDILGLGMYYEKN